MFIKESNDWKENTPGDRGNNDWGFRTKSRGLNRFQFIMQGDEICETPFSFLQASGIPPCLTAVYLQLFWTPYVLRVLMSVLSKPIIVLKIVQRRLRTFLLLTTIFTALFFLFFLEQKGPLRGRKTQRRRRGEHKSKRSMNGSVTLCIGCDLCERKWENRPKNIWVLNMGNVLHGESIIISKGT